MSNIRLLLFSGAILIFAFSVHVFAETRDLYFYVWWFDIPMHFFGGVGVGFLGLWFVEYFGLTLSFRGKITPPALAAFAIVLAAIGTVASWWEVFEVFYLSFAGKSLPIHYIEDTALDLILGALGALTVWAVFYAVQYKVWRKVAAESQQ